MSGLAKVFLVINLVLTIIFVGTSATLFSVRLDWKTACEDLHETYEKKFEEQLKQVKVLEEKVQIWTDVASVQHAEIVSLRSDNKTLNGQLSRASTELATTKTELSKNIDALKQRSTQLSEMVAQVDSLTRQFDAAKKAADEAQAKMRLANSTANEKFLELTQLQEELRAALEEKQELAEEAEQLKIRVEMLAAGITGGEPVPDLKARVMGVREGNVVLSVGQDDKVVPGMKFSISRGNTYLGDVQVSTVYKDMAGAKIIYLVDGAAIQEGDNAQTKRI
jgi:hypothetical protein